MKLKCFVATISAVFTLVTLMLTNISFATTNNYIKQKYIPLFASEESRLKFKNQFSKKTSEVNSSNITSVPTSCDLSTNEDSRYFPPIGNQEGESTCSAWATTYYQFTYAANKLNDIATTANNAYSPAWTHLMASDGYFGAYPQGIYGVLKNHGSLTMNEMPYEMLLSGDSSWQSNTEAMMKALQTRLSYYNDAEIPAAGTPITSKTDVDLLEIKQLICTGHILTVEAKTLWWATKPRYNNSDEVVIYRGVEESIPHAIAIVGYNDNVCCDVNGNGIIETSERGAFKLANSIGTDNGNNGYIWVLYDALNCRSANTTNNWEASEQGERIPIFSRFHYIEVENHDVNLAGLLTINTNHKNKLNVILFRDSNNLNKYTEINSIKYMNDPFWYQPDDNIYNANWSYNGSLVLDYDGLDDPVNICRSGFYFGVDIINQYSTNNASFSNVSFKVIDNKFNVVKQISSLPINISNGNNACKSAKIACKKGDLNYDGKITADDSTLLMNYCAMIIDLSNLQYYLGDYNNDGDVNVTDVISINQDLISTASTNELRKIEAVNQQIKQYMIDKNYSVSEIQKVDALNNSIQKVLR